MNTNIDLKKYTRQIDGKRFTKYTGNITKVTGMTIESSGPMASMGELCLIYPYKQKVPILSEVVGFRDDKILLMALGDMDGVASGSLVVGSGRTFRIRVGSELKGRVIDGLGDPIDDMGALKTLRNTSVQNSPPNPLKRKLITSPLSMGVKVIDGLLTCGKGQRIGIFAGSGVGKSTLMGMLARNSTADINVIALIGERGREVREFIENDLGKEGLDRSVVVVVTSDMPALVRVKGALVATAVAEYFRDQGLDVMLMMDSLTRFSLAQREIGLATGEPPVTRGFTPSVFATLPKLLERAGASDKGTITGLYTVLVEGDDLNEPITDTVRGILDGHIVLSRKLANVNHYPAIDVLASISRVMPNIVDEKHKAAANKIKDMLAIYRESEDLINIGAYKNGSNPKLDNAISVMNEIITFLQQKTYEIVDYEDTMRMIYELGNKIH